MYVHFRIAKKSHLISVVVVVRAVVVVRVVVVGVVDVVEVDVIISVDEVILNLFFSCCSRILLRARWSKSVLGWYPFTIPMAKITFIKHMIFTFFGNIILAKYSEEH